MAEYRLAALLEVRRKQVEVCCGALGEAVASLARAHATAREARELVDSAEARRRAATQARVKVRTAGDLASAHAWDTRLVLAIRRAKEALFRAEERVLEARAGEKRCQEALALARREREAIEKHHDAWAARQRRIRQRRAEAEADDRMARKV